MEVLVLLECYKSLWRNLDREFDLLFIYLSWFYDVCVFWTNARPRNQVSRISLHPRQPFYPISGQCLFVIFISYLSIGLWVRRFDGFILFNSGRIIILINLRSRSAFFVFLLSNHKPISTLLAKQEYSRYWSKFPIVPDFFFVNPRTGILLLPEHDRSSAHIFISFPQYLRSNDAGKLISNKDDCLDTPYHCSKESWANIFVWHYYLH